LAASRRMRHERLRPSFETPRKRAAPLAITAKPLRGDEVSTKRKRPWGAGVFGRLSQLGVVYLGSWGLNYPRGDFGGLVKRPREFVNSC
jgi:hypothetical protein